MDNPVGAKSSNSDLNFTVKELKETDLSEAMGQKVKFIDFENVPEGDVVKLCVTNTDMVVPAIMSWAGNKHPGFKIDSQETIKIVLNGDLFAGIKATLSKKKLFKKEPEIRKMFFAISE
jgi:hypothetical protein